MKRLFLVVLAIVLMALPACAINLGWDQHTDASVQGYLLQWSETTAPPEVFSKNIPGIATTQAEIPDNLFKLNTQYDIWLRAYNNVGESEKSDVLQFVRQGYLPPADNIPREMYDAPDAVINFINQ